MLVEGERELARVLERVYSAMRLPFRPQSVGSLRRAGYGVGTQDVIEAFAAEAERVYGAVRVKLDEKTLRLSIAASQHVGFASISARSGI